MGNTLAFFRERFLQKEGEITSPNYKYLVQLLGFLFFGYFFFLAVVYYKERMLAFDPAFFSFEMIQNNGFAIALGRWGMIFTEIIPYIGLKMGCSLKTFLILFSVAPIINYYLIFLCITLFLDRYKVAMAMMLALCITFRMTFYYTTAELYQGIALAFLFWALISERDAISKRRMIFSVLLIVTISYYHQLTVFLIVFILLFELLLRKKENRREIFILLAFSLVWYAIRIFLLTNTTYEQDKIPSASVIIQQLPNLLHLPSTVHFREFMHTQSLPFLALLVLGLGTAIWTKRFLLAALALIFTIGFLVLILITYYKGESTLGYENYYTVLGFFPALLFLETASKKIKPVFVLLLITPLLLKCGKAIFSSHYILTERVNYIDRLVKHGRRLPQKKYILYPANVNRDIVDAPWAIAFETLLYSSLEDPNSAVTFYYEKDDYTQYDSLVKDPNLFLGFPGALNWFDIKGMRKEYYNLSPATNYIKLNTTSNGLSTISDSIVTINPIHDTIYNNALTYVIVPVDIINSGDAIHSIASPGHEIYLSYRLFANEREINLAEPLKTPLEADVSDHYVQGVTVFHGLQMGNYKLEIFLSENGVEVKSKKSVLLIVK